MLQVLWCVEAPQTTQILLRSWSYLQEPTWVAPCKRNVGDQQVYESRLISDGKALLRNLGSSCLTRCPVK